MLDILTILTIRAALAVDAVDTWVHAVWRRDERGLTTVESAVLAVGLVVAASILVAVILAVVKSHANDLKTRSLP